MSPQNRGSSSRGASLHLDLKVGSWHEACAQHVSNGPLNALFVFPGRQNILQLHKAGLAEPPAGTIFVELVDGESPEIICEAQQYGWPIDLAPTPHFKTITSDGWLPLGRGQVRLLALALAAITEFKSATANELTAEVAGEATMPGATRGRYRARRAPADDDGIVSSIGVLRDDLYGGTAGSLSFTTVSSVEYRALVGGARFFRAAKRPLAAYDGPIPLMTMSASPDEAARIALKLSAAEPLGVTWGEMDGALAAILIGLNNSYLLIDAREHREELMLWRHEAATGGEHAVVVEDAAADSESGDASTHSIYAVFECGAARD